MTLAISRINNFFAAAQRIGPETLVLSSLAIQLFNHRKKPQPVRSQGVELGTLFTNIMGLTLLVLREAVLFRATRKVGQGSLLVGVVGIWGLVENKVLTGERKPKQPVHTVTKADVEKLPHTLGKRVFGQKSAVNSVAQALELAHSGLKEPTKPLSFLFIGGTGTGKTEMAKAIARFLTGPKATIIRYDLSEYSTAQAATKFTGSAPGFLGYGKIRTLAHYIRQGGPRSVILFDEVEKAHASIHNLLFQLIDEGRFRDSNGISIVQPNLTLIFTSNLPLSRLRTKLSKAFVGRISRTCNFGGLSSRAKDQIVERKLLELVARAGVGASPESIRYLQQKIPLKHPDGARGYARQVEEEVGDLILQARKQKKLPKGTKATLQVKDDRLELAGVLGPLARKPLSDTIDPKIALELERHLEKRVFGQEATIKGVASDLRVAVAGTKLGQVKRPTSFLFLGPTGTGKTELAKTIAELLNGKNANIIRYDLSEYSDHASVTKLLGAAPQWLGHGTTDTLVDKVKNNGSRSVIIFDELEKAHAKVRLALLPLIDEGRFTDGNGNTIVEPNLILAFTSNLPLPALRKELGSEFIGRIGRTCLFSPLDATVKNRIVQKQVNGFISEVQENQKVTVTATPAAITYLQGKLNHKEPDGARGFTRTLEREVSPLFAIAKLQGKLVKGTRWKLDKQGDKLALLKDKSKGSHGVE